MGWLELYLAEPLSNQFWNTPLEEEEENVHFRPYLATHVGNVLFIFLFLGK